MKKLLIVLALALTSCGSLQEIEYNRTVDVSRTTIDYKYGIYGWGYYDNINRFYGPNNYTYGTRYFVGPRIIIKPRRATRRVTRVARPSNKPALRRTVTRGRRQ